MAVKKTTGKAAKAYKQGSQAGQGTRGAQLGTTKPGPTYTGNANFGPKIGRTRAQTAYGLTGPRSGEYQKGFLAGRKAAQAAEGPKRSVPRSTARSQSAAARVRRANKKK